MLPATLRIVMRIFQTTIIEEKAICGQEKKACGGMHAG